MAGSYGKDHAPKIIQWLLDTRPLWPVPQKASPRERVAELKSTASEALSFLTAAEQASVLRYYHLKDAKMSLASHLLKHLIITRYCSIPWSQSAISRDANGKPCFVPPHASSSEADHVEFNVSHQAGIISLIAVIGARGVNVGTDVVCVSERLQHDYKAIDRDGFFQWVDIHADVFAPSEVSFMKVEPVDLDLADGIQGYGRDATSRCQWRNQVLDITLGEGEDRKKEQVQSNLVIDKKLRRFYAMWCLREAFVKMTGEALLAPWLQELEILGLRTPGAREGMHENGSLGQGELAREFRIRLKGKLVTNVEMELTALGPDYIVGGAVRSTIGVDKSDLAMGKWEILDLERDILAFGEPIP